MRCTSGRTSRSMPLMPGVQRFGSLPYRPASVSFQLGARSARCNSSWRVPYRQGGVPLRQYARVHDQHAVLEMHQRPVADPFSSRRSAASGAARISSIVSPFFDLRMPADTDSRCRSWLPSTEHREVSQRAMMSRSVASDSGPRLIRSPANHRGVPSGGAALASSCWEWRAAALHRCLRKREAAGAVARRRQWGQQ